MTAGALAARAGTLLGVVRVGTTGGFVVYESCLELARLLLGDFDPQVEQIYAQPFRLVARLGDRARHHVPDFLLVSAAGTILVLVTSPENGGASCSLS